MINWHDFHFLRPGWLLALLPLALLWLGLIWQMRRQTAWQSICDSHLLPHLLVSTGQARQRWPLLLLALSWLLAVLALAGPAWQRLPQPVIQSKAAKILALDLSPEMATTDIPPSRLTRAQYKMLDILRQAKEGQTGLIVFSDEPYVVTPLTQDNKTIEQMVTSLSPDIMPVAGRDIGRALQLSADLLTRGGASDGEIILLTAGPVTDKDLAVAKKLHADGFNINVLAMGTKDGAPITTENGQLLTDDKGAIIISKLDQQGLRELARVGGGQFVPFSHQNQDVNRLVQLLKAQNKALDEAQSKQNSEQWRDEGRWLVWAILPLAVLGFRRGWFAEMLQ